MFQKNKPADEKSVKIIRIDGNEMTYDEDENGYFLIKNPRGSVEKRMSLNKFIETMVDNDNKVMYNGQEYAVEAENDANSYWLINPTNRSDREKISRAEYLAILGVNAQRNNSHPNISTHKSISSSEGGNLMFHKPQEIEMTSRK